MREITIKKRSGGLRKIVVPSRKEKKRLRAFLPELNNAQLAYCDEQAVHGFMPGANAVTCALPHVGYQYSLSCDLSEFFDTVNPEMVEDLPIDELPSMFYLNRAAQGLPTSPAIANLAAVEMDQYLINYCKEARIIYTRYADDMTFSSNNKEKLLTLRDQLEKLVSKYGFKLNKKKTRLQSAGPRGDFTREVVGVGVNHKGVLPLRTSKRKLRAARHRLSKEPTKVQQRIVRGLEEWNALKTPAPADRQAAKAYFVFKKINRHS